MKYDKFFKTKFVFLEDILRYCKNLKRTYVSFFLIQKIFDSAFIYPKNMPDSCHCNANYYMDFQNSLF